MFLLSICCIFLVDSSPYRVTIIVPGAFFPIYFDCSGPVLACHKGASFYFRGPKEEEFSCEVAALYHQKVLMLVSGATVRCLECVRGLYNASWRGGAESLLFPLALPTHS